MCVCVSTGSPKDPGILPRTLDAVFRHINGRLYEQMDLKPYLNSDVQKLDPDQLKMERSAKTALFSLLKEVPLCTLTWHLTRMDYKMVFDLCLQDSESARTSRSRSSSSSSINSLSFSGVSYDQTGNTALLCKYGLVLYLKKKQTF